MGRSLILLLCLGIALPLSAKYKVCGITINSPDEMQTFKRFLPQSEFEFVELTDHASSLTGWEREEGWFNKACESGVTCDVLLVSGHFGGEFFSSNSDLRLSTSTLERHSCQNDCTGILNHPTEVFLFGCNTLADKQPDHRTPAQYLQVLLDDGIAYDVAERVVQSRYGALGSSYKHRMQRTFENVPHLYGFDSVGPAGNTAVPFLERYFSKIGSYSAHLGRLQGASINQSVEDINRAVQKPENAVLEDVMATTAFTQCAGISRDDVAYELKTQICDLHDANKPVADRLKSAETMLKGKDGITLLPSVATFLADNRYSLTDLPEFTSFKKDPEIRAFLAKMRDEIQGSPTAQLDILKMQDIMGIYSAAEYKDEAKRILAPHLENLTREGVDLICSNYDLKLEMTLDDFSKESQKSPYMLPAVACHKTSDPRIAAAGLSVFNKKMNDEYLAGNLYGASRVPGMDAEFAQIGRKHLNGRDYVKSSAALLLLQKGSSEDQKRAVEVALSSPDNLWILDQALQDGKFKFTDEVAARYLAHAESEQNLSNMGTLAKYLPLDSKLWPQLLQTKMDSESGYTNMSVSLAARDGTNPAITQWAFERWQDPSSWSIHYVSDILAHSRLNEEQIAKLFKQLEDPSFYYGSLVRGILKNQTHHRFSPEQQKLMEGEVSYYECKILTDGQHRIECNSL